MMPIALHATSSIIPPCLASLPRLPLRCRPLRYGEDLSAEAKGGLEDSARQLSEAGGPVHLGMLTGAGRAIHDPALA